jgi:hypothetical protein
MSLLPHFWSTKINPDLGRGKFVSICFLSQWTSVNFFSHFNDSFHIISLSNRNKKGQENIHNKKKKLIATDRDDGIKKAMALKH